MKILLITPYFYPHKGGSQTYAEELHIRLLKKYPNTLIDVLCYNTDNSKSVEKYRGLTIYRVPCLQILPGQFAIPNYVILWQTLRKLFKKTQYDLINSHTRFFENSWWVPIAARHFKTKSVLTDHCANHPTHSSSIINAVARNIDTKFVPLILKKYDLVTVTNKATKKFITDISKVKTSLVYGGVDVDTFKPKKRGKRFTIKKIQHTFNDNDVIVSFVGRMIVSKGPDTLLQVAEEITGQHPNVYFVFAGNGPLYNQLKKKKTKNTFFLGDTNKNDVASLLSKTDILVHPSKHSEGFPNVLLEAGASGCAIITTSMGGSTEIVTPQTGIIVKPEAASIQAHLEKLIADKAKREKLGENARKRMEELYSWKTIATVYKQTISTI